MVVLGYDSTVAVTVDDMIHHGKATRRGATDTFIAVDMPFGSYHGSYDQNTSRSSSNVSRNWCKCLKA